MYDIALIPGDGIGPEVTTAARRVIERVATDFRIELNWNSYPFGADHYLETDELLPDSKLRELADHDAIFLGAIGDPRVETGKLERGIVGKIRFDLDLYVNLRPIRVYNEDLCPLKNVDAGDIDMLVVRENTEDVYAGIGGQLKKGTPQEVSSQDMIYTRHGTERIIEYAYRRAEERNQKLTLVDKYNAIEAHGIYRRVLEDLSDSHPVVETETNFVDAMTMWMIKNPSYYDTVVTTNMFGDIITDLGAMIQGGLGIAAGGNLHPEASAMFEPIHGSAPKYTGENVVSPIAAILAGAMMLDYLDEPEAANTLKQSVEKTLSEPERQSVSASADFTTAGLAEQVLEYLDA